MKWIVYRRNDGFINAGRFLPKDYVTGGVWESPIMYRERITKGLPHEGADIPVTFTKLGEYEDWLLDVVPAIIKFREEEKRNDTPQTTK